MLRNDERWVVYMESQISWIPSHAPGGLDMAELGKVLESVVDTTQASLQLDPKNGDEIVTLDSVTWHPSSKPEFLVLLFSYANTKGADPGFKNLATRKNRTEHKKKGEGVAASAHLVISLKTKSRKRHTYYPSILEDVTGLGKTKIQRAVTNIVNSIRKFSFKDENGITRSSQLRFEMVGLDDEQVTKDASNGKMAYFVAIKETRDHPLFDDSSAIKVNVTRRELTLRPATRDTGSIKEMLRAVGDMAKRKGYDKVRVHYVRKDGKNRSVTFGTHREDAEDFLIKRIERISLAKPVAQTHDVPCEELIGAMAKQLRKG